MIQVKPNQRVVKKGERRNNINISNNSNNSASNISSSKYKGINWR